MPSTRSTKLTETTTPTRQQQQQEETPIATRLRSRSKSISSEDTDNLPTMAVTPKKSTTPKRATRASAPASATAAAAAATAAKSATPTKPKTTPRKPTTRSAKADSTPKTRSSLSKAESGVEDTPLMLSSPHRGRPGKKDSIFGATTPSVDENSVATPESNEEEISDLSDIEDPHFDKIMSPASVAGNKHIVFDSDAEIESDDEPEAAPAAPVVAAATGEDSDNDDDAPEVIATKKPAPQDSTQPPRVADEPVSETKVSKKQRARHRKRAAESLAKAMDAVSKLTVRPDLTMPSEIPAEFRLETNTKKSLTAFASEKPTKASGDGKLDASLLEQFASESKKRSADAGADSKEGEKEESARKRRKVLADKRKKNKKTEGVAAVRVMSGIRVVASKPVTKTDLLDRLALMSPSKKVKHFLVEKRGGQRVKRSNPMVAIARGNKQAAFDFFKK
ncbi:hypothetical protein LPJ66_000101 [Kickxella alabastrina]|uniref:Uncharacterized protein n=1 Tax=Kickxella alabastrina TaxID=61397 RepID=A0ACC1IX08_9FUNG|nr:hypothetical protein LPJ66_000101 [Kickxella alabastrina]